MHVTHPKRLARCRQPWSQSGAVIARVKKSVRMPEIVILTCARERSRGQNTPAASSVAGAIMCRQKWRRFILVVLIASWVRESIVGDREITDLLVGAGGVSWTNTKNAATTWIALQMGTIWTGTELNGPIRSVRWVTRVSLLASSRAKLYYNVLLCTILWFFLNQSLLFFRWGRTGDFMSKCGRKYCRVRPEIPSKNAWYNLHRAES